MTRKKQTTDRRLSTADLREVTAGLMPYFARFSLQFREARRGENRFAPRRRDVSA